jgi:hypothetical protein
MSRARIIADLSGGFGIDSGALSFGTDKEITLTHDPDDGLILKHAATADDSFPELTLQTGDTDIAINDILGRINFQAPDEGAGTDAILVAGAIAAISEGDFSSSSNATSLIFQTGASETATTKMTLSSGGNLTVTGNVSVGGDLDVTGDFDMSDANLTNVGSIQLDSIFGDADANTSITFSGSDVITFVTDGSTAATFNASQILTLEDDLIIKSGGTIGGANDTDLLTFGNGTLTVAGEVVGTGFTGTLDGILGSGTAAAATTTTRASTTITASGIIKTDDTTEATSTTDGSLQTDGGLSVVGDAVFGDDVKLLSDAAVISFGADSDITITHAADTGLTTNGTFTATGFIIGNADINETDLEKIDGITNGAGAASKALVLDSNADVASGLRNLTASGTLQGTTITATTAFVPDASDGAALGTTALEFSDLFLADGAVISLGDDQDVTLTHVVDTGILLSSTDQFQFGDSGTFISQSADGILDLQSDNIIELTGTTIDINGNVEISGTTAQVGVSTSTAKDIFNAGMSVKNGATGAGFIEFFEDSDNGTNKVTVIGPASTADVTLTLPAATGTVATTASAADEATALAIALG